MKVGLTVYLGLENGEKAIRLGGVIIEMFNSKPFVCRPPIWLFPSTGPKSF